MNRSKEIDLAISVVATLRHPGERFSHKQIARAAGCSHGLIVLIEKQALRKIRNHFRKEMGLNFGEFAVSNAADL